MARFPRTGLRPPSTGYDLISHTTPAMKQKKSECTFPGFLTNAAIFNILRNLISFAVSRDIAGGNGTGM